MKLIQANILLIFLAFHAVSTDDIYISKSYQTINLPRGETEVGFYVDHSYYSYDDKSPFIFFAVSKDIYFYDYMNYFSDIDIFLSNEWYSIESKSYNEKYSSYYYFYLRNENTAPVQFTFINTYKSININLKTFLNWKYNITFQSTIQPIPILFKISTIEKDTIIYFNMTTEGEIVGGYKHPLYYCLNENGKCDFEEVANPLKLKKGKKYKIKLHPIKLEKIDDIFDYDEELYKYYYPPIEYTKFNEIDNEENDDGNGDDDEDDGFPLLYTILISVGGLVFVVALIFIIIRCTKKRQDINFNQKTEEISQQQLLN